MRLLADDNATTRPTTYAENAGRGRGAQYAVARRPSRDVVQSPTDHDGVRARHVPRAHTPIASSPYSCRPAASYLLALFVFGIQ
jgi:hypothetical protein